MRGGGGGGRERRWRSIAHHGLHPGLASCSGQGEWHKSEGRQAPSSCSKDPADHCPGEGPAAAGASRSPATGPPHVSGSGRCWPDLMLVARTTGSPRFCGARAVRLRAVPRPPRVARGTERRSPPEAPRDAEAPLAADLPRRGCWAPLAAARPRRGWRRSADRPHSPAHSGAPGRALSGGARGLLAVDMAGTPGVANGRPARQNDR
ncbi:unnamed protein product [Prorocentrum cordatum]|uniref:Uncharacterized protein n=1 Tax=Prorocentrum cordatum TaxID=2364126 RepID=A0ABN9XNC2_9DINO|nr:unnamed protein product [Polarella glacialis]